MTAIPSRVRQLVGGEADDATVAFAWYIPTGGTVETGTEYVTDPDGANAQSSLKSAHIQRVL